jgi:hypothetical protein
MTNVSNPAPGSPWTPERVRVLKIAVAIMTTLLILGIVALVYGVARQAAKLGSASSSAPALPAQSLYGQSLALGRGELKSVSVADGFIVLYWKGEASDTIVTLETKSGRELGRIQVPHR